MAKAIETLMIGLPLCHEDSFNLGLHPKFPLKVVPDFLMSFPLVNSLFLFPKLYFTLVKPNCDLER